MSLLDDFRTKNPDYKDVPDNELAPALYDKFYKDKMSSQEFAQKVVGEGYERIMPEYEFSPMGAGVVGAAQGLTFGLADELAGGVAGLGGMATGEGFVPAYERTMAEQQAAIQAAKEQQPIPSIAGEVVGALGTGLTGGAKLAGSQLLQRAPISGAAGLGGLSGGAYEYATGYGGVGERLEGVPTAATIGTVAGGGLAGIGRGLERSLTKRAERAFQQQQADDLVGLGGEALQETPDFRAVTGEAIDLPKGAATGDVDLMRLEEAARQGQFGGDVQRQIQAVDEEARRQVQQRVQSLVGQTVEESPEILAGGLGKVQEVFEIRKAMQGRLMKARNDAIAKAGVYKDYANQTLGRQIQDLAETPDFQVALPKEANAALRDEITSLNRILNKEGDVNFAFLQSWRSGLNDLRKGGDQKAVLAGDLAKTYDNWLEGITKDALISGDEDIANKIFTANKEYSKFKSLYGTDKRKGQNTAIEDILNKEALTPEQGVNLLFGKNIQGNAYTAQNVKRMLDGLEDDALRTTVKDEFRGGLVKRAYENATKTGELKLGTLKNELIKLRKSEPYKMNLADPDADLVMDNLIKDLGKVVSSQTRRDVYSPSAPAMIRGMSYFLDKAGMIVPSARAGAAGLEAMGQAAGRRPAKRQVEAALRELINEADQTMQSKARVYGGFVGGTAPQPLVGDE